MDSKTSSLLKKKKYVDNCPEFETCTCQCVTCKRGLSRYAHLTSACKGHASNCHMGCSSPGE